MARYNYYILSVLIHVAILIMFGVYFDDVSNLKKFGNTQATAVSAFIYQDDLSQSDSVADKVKVKSRHVKELIRKDPHSLLILKTKHSKEQQDANQKQVSSRQSSVSQGELATTLVALLHDAIQRKQQYPSSAWEMQREGRVTVVFQLYPDGHISNLKILTSSGTSSLDQAAVQAVNNAAPFRELLAYIKQVQEYQIDIVFELA